MTRSAERLIVGDLFHNFAQSWKKETGEKLAPGAFADYHPRCDSHALYIMGQILRTQAQYGREDIKQCYLQAVSNASQYIHIENQYFRWPPLAEKIKASAAGQNACGRKPETHGPLYLFVITNATDAGVGAGTVNTWRMLESLGRADAIPGVTRLERAADLEAQLGKAGIETRRLELQKRALDAEARQLQGIGGASASLTRRYEALNEKLAAAREREKVLAQEKEKILDKENVIVPEERPGLKCHLCTLVAPDTRPGEAWVEVYIHAKLMLIDDAFMTLGSANLNTRSMQVDSELNIAHHRPEITQGVRRRLWEMHTNGQGAQDRPGEAFKAWEYVINKNKGNRNQKMPPVAPLVEFLRLSEARTNKD